MQSAKEERQLPKNVTKPSKSVHFVENPTCLMSNVHKNDKKKFVWKRRQQEYNFQKQLRSDEPDEKLGTTSIKPPQTSSTSAKQPRLNFESQPKFNPRLNHAKGNYQSPHTMMISSSERKNGNAMDRDISVGCGPSSSFRKISTSTTSSTKAIGDQPNENPRERKNRRVVSFRPFYTKDTGKQPMVNLPPDKKTLRKDQLGKTSVSLRSSLLKATSPSLSSTKVKKPQKRRRRAINNFKKIIPKLVVVNPTPMASACYNGKNVKTFESYTFDKFFCFIRPSIIHEKVHKKSSQSPTENSSQSRNFVHLQR